MSVLESTILLENILPSCNSACQPIQFHAIALVLFYSQWVQDHDGCVSFERMQ